MSDVYSYAQRVFKVAGIAYKSLEKDHGSTPVFSLDKILLLSLVVTYRTLRVREYTCPFTLKITSTYSSYYL